MGRDLKELKGGNKNIGFTVTHTEFNILKHTVDRRVKEWSDNGYKGDKPSLRSVMCELIALLR